MTAMLMHSGPRLGKLVIPLATALSVLLVSPSEAQPGGNALSFLTEENDFLRLPADASLNSNEFTYEVWVRREAELLDQHCVLGRSANAIGQANGLVLTYGYLGTDAWTVFLDGNPFSGSTSHPLGQWAHLAVVYDGNEIVLYLNGEEEVRAFYPQVMNWDSDIYFGVEQDCLEGCLDRSQAHAGLLDDIRIWSAPRTPEQVRNDMQSEFPSERDHLVAHFTLEEGGGPLAIDSSGAENHALLGIPNIPAPLPDLPNVGISPGRVRINISGNVNVLFGEKVDTLFVNGSPGNLGRAITLPSSEEVHVTVNPPRHGPATAPFALYAYVGGTTGPSESPMSLGWTTFPTAAHGSEDPSLRTLVNNIGPLKLYGQPSLNRRPAPTSVVFRRSPQIPLSVSLQAYIRDNGSANPGRISISNSIDLRIVD